MADDGLGVIWTCDGCQTVVETSLDDTPAGWLIEEYDEDDYPEPAEIPNDVDLCGACRPPQPEGLQDSNEIVQVDRPSRPGTSDGPEWTPEEHAAYARASMGEPTSRPGDGATCEACHTSPAELIHGRILCPTCAEESP